MKCDKRVIFNIEFSLFNISALFNDNTAEARDNLVTRGTNSFAFYFRPRFFQFFFFNFSTFECDTVQAFLSKIDHIPKSIGLRSGGKEGGQSSFDKKGLKVVLAPGLNHFGCVSGCPILL